MTKDNDRLIKTRVRACMCMRNLYNICIYNINSNHSVGEKKLLKWHTFGTLQYSGWQILVKIIMRLENKKSLNIRNYRTHSDFCYLVARTGFEPVTSGL